MEFNGLLISLSQEFLLCLRQAVSHGELVHAFYQARYGFHFFTYPGLKTYAGLKNKNI